MAYSSNSAGVVGSGQFLSIKNGGTLMIEPGGIFIDSSSGTASGFIFTSGIETGTGSQQTIPHGLGGVPEGVIVSPYNNTNAAEGLVGGKFTISESAPADNVNIYVTATLGLDYKVMALKF